MNGPDRPGRRSILVTGGSQGLGMAAATRFAARGHRVLLTSRSGERARAAAEQVRARVSMTDPQDVVGEALAELDALVGYGASEEHVAHRMSTCRSFTRIGSLSSRMSTVTMTGVAML